MNTYDYIINKYKIKVGHQYLIDVEAMKVSVALSKLFAELNFNKGVEIGVDKGEFSEVFCKDNPNLHLFSVDPSSPGAYEDGNFLCPA